VDGQARMESGSVSSERARKTKSEQSIRPKAFGAASMSDLRQLNDPKHSKDRERRKKKKKKGAKDPPGNSERPTSVTKRNRTKSAPVQIAQSSNADTDSVGKKSSPAKGDDDSVSVGKKCFSPKGDDDLVSIMSEDSTLAGVGKPPSGKKKSKSFSNRNQKKKIQDKEKETEKGNEEEKEKQKRRKSSPKSLATGLDSSLHSAGSTPTSKTVGGSLNSPQTPSTKKKLKKRSPSKSAIGGLELSSSLGLSSSLDSASQHSSASTSTRKTGRTVGGSPNTPESPKKRSKSKKRSSSKGALAKTALSASSNTSPNQKDKDRMKDAESLAAPDVVGDGFAPTIQEEKKDGTDDSSEKVSSKGAPEPLKTSLVSAEPLENRLSRALPPQDLNFSVHSQDDFQRQEVLRLQLQLSEALQKVVMTTEEQIHDKDHFFKVSTDLTRLQANYTDICKERDDLKEKLEDRESKVEHSMRRVDKLEGAIERQLDEQDRLLIKLERSEDEIEKLLIEIQDLESAVQHSESGGGNNEGLRSELKEAKKTLVDKQREIDDQKSRIEDLEKELSDSAIVYGLQVDELETENKALQGKLKGDWLEMSSKLSKKEDTIAHLQKELHRYKNDGDAEDLASVRDDFSLVQAELGASRNDVEVAQRMLNKTKSDKEDLIERNNVLNEKMKVLQKNVNELTEKSKDLGDKVLQWTEKTYEWKSRAESAEKKVEAYREDRASDDGSDLGNVCEEAPQGLFLQAVMAKKETKTMTRPRSRWSMFNTGANPSDGEDLSPEEVRIKGLEERNLGMEEIIAELRSEIVKVQTAHKEEAYSTKKKIAQLQGENDALSLKNDTLELLCGDD
jgi:hypothetical protein